MIDRVHAGKFVIDVLYEDNHLLAVVKPPNLPVQADCSGDDDLLSIMKRYIGNKYQKPGNVYLGLVHRLDRPVGGVMVLARTSKAAARLSAAFAAHAQDKRYLAVLQGDMPGELTLEDHLLKDGCTGMVRVVSPDVPGAKLARLRTRPLATREGLTLAEVTLWGDARYGGGKPGQQIALWAASLALEHPTRREPLRFSAPPPEAGAWQPFNGEIETWFEEHEG